MIKKNVILALSAAAVATMLTACGGGGSSAPVIYYPYETVYGDVCVGTQEPTPGCTFNRNDTRVIVSQDPDFNRAGYGSDDLWYVKFDGSGRGAVYNDLGVYQYTADISKFAGWVGGNQIGVGTTGLFWENVSFGTYWLGRNGVLYSANTGESNFGEAINDKDSQDSEDTNLAALSSDANKRIVKMAAQKLEKQYQFSSDKAMAVASALNKWAVSGVERGYTTDVDLDKTFKSVFGVEYKSALSAVKDLQSGSKDGIRALTDRSADALGLKPSDAQRFIKDMYKGALAEYGFDADSLNW